MEFSYLLLKNDDQGNEADLHKTTYHTADHLHVQQFGQFPESPDENNPQKDIDRYGTPYKFIDIVEKNGDKDNVYNIRNSEFQKV
jgi:hypothetical protein